MKRVIYLITLALSITMLHAQQQGFDALKADYPQLMQKFGKELQDQRADYIFAIDVSGTMCKYQQTVVPALSEFFKSLQMGDYVSIIKFGGEATNEVGSAGKISQETVKNLIGYAGHIYDKPTTEYEREKYFRYTDLENMLRYLATDMKQIDRSKLKFVFIITDFIHDPSAARKGKEDWAGIARRFATEQAGNDVYMFALQLPGSGRDLEKVRGVFPKSFNFCHVPITSGTALSEWFTQRKNAILLDKFYALVKHKITPAEFAIEPETDIDGNLSLGVTWKPNAVYDKIRIDAIETTAKGFTLDADLPQCTTKEDDVVEAGKFCHKDAGISNPSFKNMRGEVTARASFDVPYEAELCKLGFAAPRMQATARVDKLLFCYPLPLWLCCVIILLIIIYIILVIRAFKRNHSAAYMINGKFEVTETGIAVTERKKANALSSIDFGKGAGFLPVPDANWHLRIDVKTHNPFLLPLKRPSYVVSLLRGSSFKVGAKYGPHQHPSIAQCNSINVGDYRIKWMAP